MKSFIGLLAGLSISLVAGVQASFMGNIRNIGDVFPRLAQNLSQNCTLYTVQSGDTCFSIASGNNATYAQIVGWNSNIINTVCSNLGNLTNSTICVSNPLGNFALPTNGNGQTSIATTAAPIPAPTVSGTNAECGQYYYVQAGDGCSTIGTQFGISLSDFIFLNPELWSNCTNLLADYYYCVEPVGYISTYPSYGATTTTSAFNQTAATSLPNVGNILANYTNTQPVIPIANDTRLDCYRYIYFDNLTDNGAADCWLLSMIYGITGEDFILWNPSLASPTDGNDTYVADNSAGISAMASTVAAAAIANANAVATANANAVATANANATATATATTTANAYAYPCTLSANTSYCVALMSPTAAPAATSSAPPSPRAAGEAANCTLWYAPQSFDTCSGILTNFYLTIAHFYAMNPSVGSDCSTMDLGTYYCISTYPGGIPPGQPYSAISASLNGTTTSTTTTTTTTTTTSTGTGTGTGMVTPSPIQSGMVTDCDEFYDVHSGDGCYAIAQSYSIALTDFYAWNPAVSTDCSGLEASVYVCIGVETTATATTTTTTPTTTSTGTGIVTPTPTQSGMVSDCGDFYLVVSGDGCYNIAAAQGIALSDFYAWNPAVNTDCSGLDAGYYVCVGIE